MEFQCFGMKEPHGGTNKAGRLTSKLWALLLAFGVDSKGYTLGSCILPFTTKVFEPAIILNEKDCKFLKMKRKRKVRQVPHASMQLADILQLPTWKLRT